MGVEHRTNAAEQGEHAARSLLAGDGPRPGFAPVPYFWSDQYGHKIQVIGSPKATAVFASSGRLSGAVGFGRPRALMAYLPLLEAGASFAQALALKPS
jgi:hypothetical protein